MDFLGDLFSALHLHVLSWKIVGFFYPTVMFALISIYPLTRLSGATPPFSSALASFLKGQAPKSSYAALAFFSFLQIFPLFFPGDAALTGEGRLFALHMFDAKVECEAYAMLKRRDGVIQKADLLLNLPVRIRCDPIVYFNRAKYLCSLRHPSLGFSDFDLHLNSKKASEPEKRKIVHVENFCASDLHYDVWRRNSWITAW